MKRKDLIPAEEICVRYKVERQFVSSLNQSGIIEIVKFEETEYIHCDHLADFEKMRRLHKELDINLLKDSLGMDGAENNGEFKITIPQSVFL